MQHANLLSCIYNRRKQQIDKSLIIYRVRIHNIKNIQIIILIYQLQYLIVVSSHFIKIKINLSILFYFIILQYNLLLS